MMKLEKRAAHFFSALTIITTMVLVSSCISDPGLAKKRGLVNDFSITNTVVGCNSKNPRKYLILPNTIPGSDASSYVCTSQCPADSSHIATDAELTDIKDTFNKDLPPNTTALSYISNSAGVCVANAQTQARPTNEIDFKSDFCL